MPSRLSALMYRAMNGLLAYHVDAVRARRASALAQTPRRSQARVRAMYVTRRPKPAAVAHRARMPRLSPARLAPTGVAVLVALVVAVLVAMPTL